MNGIAVLLSLAAVGVDYGWQPTVDGQLEYIVQIEPSLLERLKNGDEIASEIPPEARGVRRFRIRVGTGPVPRIGHLDSGTMPRKDPVAGSSPAGSGSMVLPPQSNRAGGSGTDNTTPLASTRDADFGPDGFLRLPPPPPLLGADGKSSVLVRADDAAALPSSGNRRGGEVLPPEPNRGTLSGADIPAGSSLSGGSTAGNDVELSGPAMDRSPPDSATSGRGGVFPPRFDANTSFPTADDTSDDGADQPPQVREVLPPDDNAPVRPIPGLPQDSDAPQPIRGYGSSGVKPPATSEATLGPYGPKSPPTSLSDNATNTTGTPPRDAEPTATNSADRDMLAQQDALDAALKKPAIDEETAQGLTAKPWTPLVLTSLALFASLAANLYLGWVAAGVYRRYRDVVAQLHQARASLA